MRHLQRSFKIAMAVVLGVAVSLSSATPASSHDGPGHGDPLVVQPIHKIDGLTARQLLTEQFIQIYTLPDADNPWGKGDPCVTLGRTGKVLWQSRIGTCTVEQGTAVIAGGWAGSCDTVFPPFPITAAAQRSCAIHSLTDNVVSFIVTVDGGHSVELRSPRFLSVTKQQTVTLPPGNPLGIDPQQPVTFVAAGWQGVLENLPVGQHTIGGEIFFSDGSSFVFDPPNVVNVVPRSSGGHA